MSESEAEGVTAFAAFRKLLGNLGLQEFPCGFGAWREKANLEKKTSYICPDEISAVTLKDYDAKYERVETLLEYATSLLSPWSIDCDWSNEAATLRQIAITSPQKITDKFICSYFKTLRIRDKNVIEIDADLLKLINLTELTLSANRIVDVISRNLPPSLKTLELSGNSITDLELLCFHPPPLVHLGLSYNRVDSISEHLKGRHWPYLLCLDLFHNNLCDLKEVGQTLKTLPKLQSLVLVGNPLSLVPGYRGYLIDSLPTLNILDDFTITADEKINYKSLRHQTDCIQNVAFINLSIPSVKGLPDPLENQVQTDSNIIQKSYFVRLLFIHEETKDSKESDAEEIPSSDKMIQSVHNLQMETVPEEDNNMDKKSVGSIPNIVMFDSKNAGNENIHNRSFLPSTNDSPIPTSFIQSQDLPWTENEIDFKWNEVITCQNLLPLRDYLYQDIEFEIMERKLIGRIPVVEEEEEKPTKGKGKDDKESKKKKEDKNKKEKEKAPPKTDAKSKGGNRKDKKNKVSNENVIWSAPEFKVMASFYLSLEPFLHGEHNVEETFIKEMGNANSELDSLKNSKKDSKGSKKSDSRVQSRAKGRKSTDPKKGKPGGRSKGSSVPSHDDDSCMIPAIEMGVFVELEHWTSKDEARQTKTS